jgi:acyl transferase domain-containing protein
LYSHLEITAFLASLSKVLSIFERGIIPPNVNLKTLNPAIAWEPYQLRVPIEPTPLPLRNGRALVAMTSSGIGGANGSCVIESPPASACKFSVDFWATNAASRPHLFVCGGLSPRTSSAVADSLLGQLKDGVQAESLVLSHGRRARSMPWITYAVTPDNDDVRFSEPILAPKGRGPLVFVFSGQGPQHLASTYISSVPSRPRIDIYTVGKELFRASNVFSQTVRDLDCIYERMAGHSLIRKYGLFDDEIDPESSLDDIWPIAVTLPALTIVQIALLDTLAFLGLKPDIVVGHSAGETATLYASGAATKELTLELSIARGRGMSSLESAGCSMAAINCTPADAERIIAQVAQEPGAGPLEIGCYNGEEALTLSGADAQLKQAVNIATERGIFARKLKTRVAVHSSMMENCREAYRTAVNDVFSRHTLSKPKVTIYSSSTGKVMLEAGGADYFWTNTRGPVFFTEAIQALVHAHSNASFLEIGPHPVLASYLSALAGSDAIIECPLRRLNPTKPKNVEVRALLTTIGRLTTTHHHVDYSLLAGPQATILHSMPAYPFQPKSIPFQLPTHEVQRFLRPRNGPLNFEELCINTATHPSLADHVINSMPIMPATGYLEMVCL